MDVETELFEICAQLQRDAGCRKVLVCGSDGEMLAHAGDRGLLDESATDAVAGVVVDALAAGNADPSATPPELQATLPGGLTACATAVLDRAVLAVVFDSGTELERVRAKMRRARERLVKTLPAEGEKNESPGKS
jgi:hypothetical protein